MKYAVIGIVHSTAYASLLRIQCLKHSTRHPLPWPMVGWVIDTLYGADAMPNKIDYRLCHAPRTLHMKMRLEAGKTYMNSQHINKK